MINHLVLLLLEPPEAVVEHDLQVDPEEADLALFSTGRQIYGTLFLPERLLLIVGEQAVRLLDEVRKRLRVHESLHEFKERRLLFLAELAQIALEIENIVGA